MRVLVEPADALIEIDGAAITGQQASVALGKHHVKASKAGYAPQTIEIDALAGANNVKLMLRKTAGTGGGDRSGKDSKRPSDSKDGLLIK